MSGKMQLKFSLTIDIEIDGDIPPGRNISEKIAMQIHSCIPGTMDGFEDEEFVVIVDSVCLWAI